MTPIRTSTRAVVLSLAAAAATTFAIAEAHAQARRSEAPPLTIQRRSFLDSGKIVPRDSLRNYVTMDTYYRRPVYDNLRGRYGLETLPRPLDPPGRPSPLFEF